MSVPPNPDTRAPVVAPLFPVAMAVGWVLGEFASSASPLPNLWRPLLIVSLAVVVLTLLAWSVGRRRAEPLLVTGLLVLFFLKAWLLFGVVVVVLIWRVVIDALRRRSHRAPMSPPAAAHVVGIANTLGIVFLVVALASVVLGGVSVISPSATQRGAAPSSAPDIYLVLLDGYPRQDSLQALGIDNSAFLAGLKDRGFAVAPRSHTNYHNTLLTLTSMLNGRYLSDLPELAPAPSDHIAELRLLQRALNASRLLDDLREHGYQIVDSPSAFGGATLFSADVVMQHGTINQFDQWAIKRSFVGEVLSAVSPGLVERWLQEAVLAPIRDGESVASDKSDDPRFMFAHVLSPHPPFLFDRSGAVPSYNACYASCSLWTTELKVLGISREEYDRLLGDQVAFIDSKVLEMVDHITTVDPDAVVVLFGDHGIRFDAGVSVEYFRNFFAARTPGHEGLFPDDVSPVNVLTAIENAYLGTSFPTLDYQGWESKGGLLLNLSRWLPDPT